MVDGVVARASEQLDVTSYHAAPRADAFRPPARPRRRWL
jgi:hypothetical protein